MYKSLLTQDLPEVSRDPIVSTKTGCNGAIHIEQCGDVHLHACVPLPETARVPPINKQAPASRWLPEPSTSLDEK